MLFFRCVRLGTCIAFELATAAAAIGGAWIGIGHAVGVADDYLRERDASASTIGERHEPPMPSRLPIGSLKVAFSTGPQTVFDGPDEALLAPLAAAPITRIKLNQGGTSLSLRIDFANGSRAAFKPDQYSYHLSDPRREIAAYRIDRLLQIGHVAPAKPARFTVEELVAAADPPVRAYTAQRLTAEGIAHDGMMSGEVQWWIPEIKDAKLGPLRIDEVDSVERWSQELKVGAPILPQDRATLEQLTAMIVFDVVIDNADRWSGSNTKSSPDQKILYFMDNAMSFSKFTHGHDTNLGPLLKIQKFPRGLIQRLRALDLATVTAALDDTGHDEGLGPLLDGEELSAIMARRDHVIDYVDRLIEQFGEDAVLAFP